MNRTLVFGLALLLCAMLSVAGFGYWCLGTTAGTRWIMQTAGDISGVKITTTELDGSLLDGVTLRGLRVAWDGGEVLTDSLSLVIHRFSPWSGTLAIEELGINRLILQVNEQTEASIPVEPEDQFSAASLAVTPEWLEVSIDRLKISGFVYRSSTNPADEVVIADLIAGQYRLVGHRLLAQGFAYHSPYVELDGDFDWQLKQPHLTMTANVRLPETCVDPDIFESIAVPVEFPARLELDGDWNGYTGPVRVGTEGDHGSRVRLAAEVTGSWSGIRLADLKGRYLGGTLNGDLDLAWIDSYRMHGQISAQDLDPSVLLKEPIGKVTFDVSGELLVPYDDQPLQAKLASLLHNGQFRGHSLQGRADGQWVGTTLVALDVDLSGDGAHLLARGVPDQKVDVDLEVTDLSAFHSSLAGKAAAKGWLSWSHDSLAGEIDGHGENLAWRETTLRSFTFTGRHLPGEEQITLDFSGEGWSHGNYHLKLATGNLAGTIADHRFKLVIDSSFGHFSTLSRGSYHEGNWDGRIEQLTGEKTPWGRWSMPHPTDLAWQAGVISINDLQLVADKGARLGLNVDQWGSPENTEASLTWTGLELAWLQPYSEVPVGTGHSDGQVQFAASAGRPVSIIGKVSAKGRVEKEYFELDYDALELNFVWDQGGLQLSGAAQSPTGEGLQVKASAPGTPDWNWSIEGLEADLQWKALNLARLNRFLEGGQLEGSSEGSLSFAYAGERLKQINGHLSAQGKVLQGEQELGPRSLQTDLSWQDGHFQCTAKLVGAKGGQASLQLTSEQEAAFAWPDSGRINLEVKGLSITALETLLPQDIEVDGSINGNAIGEWGHGRAIDLNGQIQLLNTHIGWSSEDGQIRLPLKEAQAQWQWSDDSLTGNFAMNLTEQGHLEGKWQLPLPAQIPTAIDPSGPLRMSVVGKMQAVGILSAFGPWLFQDIHGESDVDIVAKGTWEKPDLSGRISLSNGGAYLPIAGIQLEDIQLQSELAGDKLKINQLTVHSGAGSLTGQGEVLFDRWQLSGYRLQITGKDFQVVDFPELQMTCNPDLVLSGTLDRLSIQGSTLIPKLAIQGSKGQPEVLSSKDVVLQKSENKRQELGFETDIQVIVDLGDDVTIVSEGVDTRLAGGAVVTMGPTGELRAQGEIQLVSGSYRAHGANLQIRQGVLSYKGGVITNPGLRIFAAREVGEVLAGVQITGTAEAPVVSLYSKPAMPERDILGYILMGRAVNKESQESDMLMMGAGSLLPGYGGLLSDLGITDIDIQGLFTGTGGLRLRRKFAENWEVESTLGTESGIDLYYIIEFD